MVIPRPSLLYRGTPLKRVHGDLSTHETLAKHLQNISLFRMPTSRWRCEQQGVSEAPGSGNEVFSHRPKAWSGCCLGLREGSLACKHTLLPCSALFGPRLKRSSALVCAFDMSLLSEDWSSSSFSPSASLQFWRKQVDYSWKKRKSEQGGGRCHRQTPLKATGCSFTFTLLKNVN